MTKRIRSKDSPASAKSRVFLVDDHPIVVSGFTMMLGAQPDLEVCGTAPSAEAALDLIEAARPDLVITDLTLPGRGGLDLIKDLAALQPQLRILVVSMHDELLYAERALRAGARGYLMKEAGSEKLLAAIRRVLAGDVSVSERMQAKILDGMSGRRPRGGGSTVGKLSDREFEVFRLLGAGRTTKEIASQLNLSHKTVAVHRAHIKEKLGITSGTELTHHAVRWVEAEATGATI
jgi:DNA-binding NarL/FixJ family response regulator